MELQKIKDEAPEELKHLSHDMIVAQGVVFFIAGYETTANTLSTLCYNLAKNPLVQVPSSCRPTSNALHYCTFIIFFFFLLETPVRRNPRGSGTTRRTPGPRDHQRHDLPGRCHQRKPPPERAGHNSLQGVQQGHRSTYYKPAVPPAVPTTSHYRLRLLSHVTGYSRPHG